MTILFGGNITKTTCKNDEKIKNRQKDCKILYLDWRNSFKGSILCKIHFAIE